MLTFKSKLKEKKENYKKISIADILKYLKSNKTAHEIYTGGAFMLYLDIDYKNPGEPWFNILDHVHKVLLDEGFNVLDASTIDKISIHAIHKSKGFKDHSVYRDYIKTKLIPEWKGKGSKYLMLAKHIDTGPLKSLRAICQCKEDGSRPMIPIKYTKNILDYCFTRQPTEFIKHEIAEPEIYFTESSVDINIDMLRELSEIIDIKYINKYTTWLNICFALKTEGNGEDMYNLFQYISKKSKKYSFERANVTWCASNSEGITIGTYLYYCKTSDPQKYEAIRNRYRIISDNELKSELMNSKSKFTFQDFQRKYCGTNIKDHNNFMNDAKRCIGYFNDGTAKFIFKNKSGLNITKHIKDLSLLKLWYGEGEEMVRRSFYDVIGDAGIQMLLYDQIIFKPNFYDPKILNLWQGFQADELEKVDMSKIELILNHIKEVLANNDDSVYKYIINWLADLVQEPEKKQGTALVFISKDGAGKGIFMELLSKMLGENLCLSVSDLKDIAGRFNGLLSGKILVNLNETCNVEGNYHKVFDKMKSLITDKEQVIEKKGIDSIRVDDYSRFIFTTNNYYPVSASTNDRRYGIFVINDKYVGNKKYFNDLYDTYDDGIDNFFTYLMNYKREKLPIPDTEIKKDIQLSALPPKVDVFKYMYLDKGNKDGEFFTNRQLKNMFEEENVTYKSTQKMNRAVNGFLTKHRKSGDRGFIFDRKVMDRKMKEVYGISIEET